MTDMMIKIIRYARLALRTGQFRFPFAILFFLVSFTMRQEPSNRFFQFIQATGFVSIRSDAWLYPPYIELR